MSIFKYQRTSQPFMKRTLELTIIGMLAAVGCGQGQNEPKALAAAKSERNLEDASDGRSVDNLAVLVLDDSDGDYQTPSNKDTIYLIGGSDEPIVKREEFCICQTVGGQRSVAVAKDGSFIVCENVLKRMSRYGKDGKLIFSFDKDIQSVDISVTGSIYCLNSSGKIFGDSVFIIDPADGKVIKEATFGGLDLVVDDEHDSVWIVGADIKRLDRNLSNLFIKDPITWTAVSVDYASDGSAWVAERRHPDSNGSKNRLLHISLKGDVQDIELDDSPYCVAVDRKNNLVYVAGFDGVYRFDQSGKKTYIAPKRNLTSKLNPLGDSKVFGVRVDPRDSSVWTVGWDSFRWDKGANSINHYSSDGEKLLTIYGLSSSEQFIAIRK